MLTASYNPMLVLLSVLIGVGAAYTALEFAGRTAQSHGRTRCVWQAAGMGTMGVGIWSMHFIGMLALQTQVPIRYDGPLTIASLGIAVVASGLALALVGRRTLGPRTLLAGGTVMGLAIAGMHYTGMAAMQMPGMIQYQPLLVALSIAIAIASATAALWLAFWLRGEAVRAWSGRRLGAAVVMGLGMAGMHYTGMASANFVSSNVGMAPTTLSLSVTELDAVIIGFCSLFVLGAGMFGSFREHLHRKQSVLEETQRLLAAIVESSHDAILGMTPDGIITSWNPAAERLYGYTAEQAIGQSRAMLIVTDDEAASSAVLERAARGESLANVETVRRHRDGHRLDVSISLSPIRDAQGAIVGVSSIARDIRARKRAEQERARWAERLAEANAALRQADRYKDEFLSVISHELRTPLNFIMGFASVLEDELPGPLNAKQLEYMGKILAGSERMLGLVNDLLDVAKLQAGKFEIAPVPTPYAPLIEDVLASLRPLADRKRLRLEALIEAEVAPVIEAGRITQVLTNLLSNAIKFTPAGGAITLRAFVREGELVTQVTDTGIGISPDDIAKLFHRFQQLDMTNTREVGGTGLGLSICKGLVEAHGGRIGVLSEPGCGSTFWFVLPLAPVGHAGAAQGHPEAV